MVLHGQSSRLSRRLCRFHRQFTQIRRIARVNVRVRIVLLGTRVEQLVHKEMSIPRVQVVIVPDGLRLAVQSRHIHPHRRFRHLQVRTHTLRGAVGGRRTLRLRRLIVIPLHKGGFETTSSFVTRRRFILG